ncbi:hypothetical protein GCM10010960_15840 [Arenimonas maotaiensis]|uniref:Uncharacterized protein n=1 Tax=Arenimonas maotaiensis TaxID=1446479 RepID=A0A917CQ63_9GAMM|nr:hypothetical protein [Arenimonas maotaiensis]GGF94942.1 hypothetical protein GCM10010960_15840 [Arenimonas maotaiensis]
MDIQRVSAGRGAAWINQSIGLLKSGGKAIWLPALVVGVLASMPLLGAAFGILIVFFYGGLVLCFDRPSGGFDAFSGFRNGGFGRLLPVMLLNLALGIVAIVAIWPIVQPILQAASEGREATPEEALQFLSGLAGPLLWLIPLSILVHWISQFAVPLATLKRLPGGEALSQALKAVFANLPALLVNLLCLAIAAAVISVIAFIPMAVLGVLFAGNQVLANLVVLPVAALLTTVLMVLMGGNMLFAYRDVFGADAPAGDAPVSELML